MSAKQKWIITYNAGYGDQHDIVEAKTKEEADQAAYDAWCEEAESYAEYGAEPYDKETAVGLGLEDEEEEATP